MLQLQLNVTVTVRLELRVNVQGLVLLLESHPDQLAKVEPFDAVAVRVRNSPLVKPTTQGEGLAQLNPAGELVTDPFPLPANATVSASPEEPLHLDVPSFTPFTGALPTITLPDLGLLGLSLKVAVTFPAPQPSVLVYVT